MFTLILFVLGLAAAVAQVLREAEPRTGQRIVEIFLLRVLVFSVGIQGLVVSYGLVFMADDVARSIGWRPGSPFQFEVGMCNLAFGVLGLLCIWLHGQFWTATGLGASVFLLGAGVGHIRQIVLAHDYAPYNAGVLFYMDFVIPATIVVLIAAQRLTLGSAGARG